MMSDDDTLFIHLFASSKSKFLHQQLQAKPIIICTEEIKGVVTLVIEFEKLVEGSFVDMANLF